LKIPTKKNRAQNPLLQGMSAP